MEALWSSNIRTSQHDEDRIITICRYRRKSRNCRKYCRTYSIHALEIPYGGTEQESAPPQQPGKDKSDARHSSAHRQHVHTYITCSKTGHRQRSGLRRMHAWKRQRAKKYLCTNPRGLMSLEARDNLRFKDTCMSRKYSCDLPHMRASSCTIRTCSQSGLQDRTANGMSLVHRVRVCTCTRKCPPTALLVRRASCI
jgi:hypothetical protein